MWNDLYSVLTQLEISFGSRMQHTAISDSQIFNKNVIRLQLRNKNRHKNNSNTNVDTLCSIYVIYIFRTGSQSINIMKFCNMVCKS